MCLFVCVCVCNSTDHPASQPASQRVSAYTELSTEVHSHFFFDCFALNLRSKQYVIVFLTLTAAHFFLFTKRTFKKARKPCSGIKFVNYDGSDLNMAKKTITTTTSTTVQKKLSSDS